jgi:uncharacterized protein YjbJ (UPF0337 family)
MWTDIHSRLFYDAAYVAQGRLARPLFKEGNKMKPSTENEITGKVHEVKGTIKEKVGRLTNDPDLEGEGIGEKIAGKVQKKIGQLEKVFEKP